MTTHTHVATGLQGYGPDASDSDGFATFEPADLAGIAGAIRYELSSAADYNDDTAEALAESGDFEGAWTAHKLADSLTSMAHNLRPERQDAPLYINDAEKWNDTLRNLIEAANGTDITHNSRLYVWACTEDECSPDND